MAVLASNFSENISSAFIRGHMWDDEGNFNATTTQPMIYYNIPSVPGAAISYNTSTSYNWDAKRAGDRLTLPLGAGISKTFDLGDGYGLDTGVGLYINVAKPEGAADWKINWQVSVLFL